MQSTTMPVTRTMVEEFSKLQKNDPEYLQIGLGGIDTADAEVVDKPGYGLDGKIGKELDEKLDKIQKELTELEFLYNNEQLG